MNLSDRNPKITDWNPRVRMATWTETTRHGSVIIGRRDDGMLYAWLLGDEAVEAIYLLRADALHELIGAAVRRWSETKSNGQLAMFDPGSDPVMGVGPVPSNPPPDTGPIGQEGRGHAEQGHAQLTALARLLAS